MAYVNGLACKKKEKEKVSIHPYFEPDAFKLAVQLNNTSQLTALPRTGSPELSA